MTVYFWYFREVETANSYISAPGKYLGCYSVDPNVEVGHPGRTGQWGPTVWTNIPPENLPAEFRVALLVMGIPT